jgi:antirestriction protein ArdC
MAATTTTKKKTVFKDTYAEVTNRVLALLDEGTVIWHQPWRSRNAGGPRNFASKKLYRGINVFLLGFSQAEGGYASNLWGTYKQISEKGGQVRKGEKGTKIIWWNILRKEQVVDGKPVTKSFPMLKEFVVFNIEQADWPEGSKRPIEPEIIASEANETAEAVVAEYLAKGPSLRHGGDRAFYRASEDRIQMPLQADFDSDDHYYSTLYHEATHSTGHSKRLARQGIAEGTFGSFGDPVYSFEELVAEMGAAMLSAIAGIDQATVTASAAYLAHWRDVLQGDNKLIVQAAAQAQKAVDLILGTTFDNNEEEES